MSRLTEAQDVAQRMRHQANGERLPALDVLQLALQRMAQLEKVAEVARVAADLAPATTEPRLVDALWVLHLALIELDNPPDTREPTTITEL